MNKVTLGLVLLVALLGFLLLSTNKENAMQNAMPKSLKVPSVVSDAQMSTVKVSASESRKYGANEFVTVAMLELRGRDKELLFKQLETRRQAIFEQMSKLDIQNADIEQNSVDMRKEWSYDKGTRSLTGYVVSQSFAIRCSFLCFPFRPYICASRKILTSFLKKIRDPRKKKSRPYIGDTLDLRSASFVRLRDFLLSRRQVRSGRRWLSPRRRLRLRSGPWLPYRRLRRR
jgi:hypothetical protein